jgi:uncharacterized protein YndB with AHSA1/START domain
VSWARRAAALAMAGCLGLALPAGAQTLERGRYPHVADASIHTPQGDKVLRLTVDLPVPAETAYAAWSSAEGWEAFAVRHARVDFRPGGIIETTYGETFTPGARENIRNEILAILPNRLLTFRNIQAPPGFPHDAEFQTTITVLEFADLGAGRSRLTLSGVGFKPGAAYDALFAMFLEGNAQTLEKLHAHLSR